MFLDARAIGKLNRWLEQQAEDELWIVPGVKCDCPFCKIWKILSLPIVDSIYVDLQPAVELAVKLYDRFGQCDLKLLKELYEKEIVSAND